MSKVKVLIIDKSEVYKEGLSLILNSTDGLEVVAKCSTLDECTRTITQCNPDIIILDPEDGIADLNPTDDNLEIVRAREFIRQILQVKPQAGVILLTHLKSYMNIFLLLKAGASAYISKDASSRDMISAIISVRDGHLVVTPPLATELVRHLVPDSDGAHSVVAKSCGLSHREIEVLRLAREGKANKEIARILCISVNTVKVHMRNIMEKLLVHNRQQAIVALDNEVNHYLLGESVAKAAVK